MAAKVYISSRARDVARLIHERKAFNTYGALRADAFEPGNAHGTTGQLNDTERNAFYADIGRIVYIVYSYTTPIAWGLADGSAHIVEQKFSPTTGRHQSKLYLLKESEQ